MTPARDVASLPSRLCTLVSDRLRRLGVSDVQINAELGIMRPVAIGKALDRSVIGILGEFGRLIDAYIPAGSTSDEALVIAESRLQRVPCFASRRMSETVFPDAKARELLRLRWGPAPP